MQIEPYLFFDGRAEEAAEFYKRALGAEVEMLMRFKESPAPESIPPGGGDKVMHMSLKIGGSRVMGSDVHCHRKACFAGVSLSPTLHDEATAEQFFAPLAQGGEVPAPSDKTLFPPPSAPPADTHRPFQ